MRLRWLGALVVGYFVYLLIGAAIFMAIERPNEEQNCQEAINTIEQLKIKISSQTNVTTEDLKDITRFTVLTQVLQSAAANGISVDENFNVSCTINFDFQSAFFFSGTVVTTIGYGNISPKTSGGRTFCIFYALFGIPLFAIMFTAIGEKLAKLVKRVDKRIKLKIERIWLRSALVFTVFAASLVLFCLLIPAAIFMAVEKWTYRESFYYSFITLTTIGFGDFVVGTNSEIEYIPIYRVLVYFWILFGCAYMASTISLASNLMQKSVRRTTPEEEAEAEKQRQGERESDASDSGQGGAVAITPYYDDVPEEEDYVNGDAAQNERPDENPVDDEKENDNFDYKNATAVGDTETGEVRVSVDGENETE